MPELEKSPFDAEASLASTGVGRRIVKLREKQIVFSQGEAADSGFYLQSSRSKLTVVSGNGKEATISLLDAGDFVGEESLASADTLHMATATAASGCPALKIESKEMLHVMHWEHSPCEIFMTFLIARGMRIESDLAR